MNDVAGVGAELFGIGGIANVGDGGMRIFDRVSKGKITGRAPGPAVIEVKNVPSGAAEGLRKIEIFLVAGESVEKDDDRMRACTGRDVGERIELGAVAGDLKCLHCSRVCFVWCRIGRDGRGELLGADRTTERGAKKHGSGDEMS
jgi:hypothetical protein